MSTAELQRVLDLQDIAYLKARYCRCIDLQQWETLRTLFTTEAQFEGFPKAPDASGVEGFCSGVAGRLKGAVTAHHLHQPDIQLTGPDTARGVWAMQDYNEWPHAIGVPGSPQAVGFRGYGFYEEEYRRVDGAWKICFMRLTRLRLDPLFPDAGRPFPATANAAWLRPSAGWMPRRLS